MSQQPPKKTLPPLAWNATESHVYKGLAGYRRTLTPWDSDHSMTKPVGKMSYVSASASDGSVVVTTKPTYAQNVKTAFCDYIRGAALVVDPLPIDQYTTFIVSDAVALYSDLLHVSEDMYEALNVHIDPDLYSRYMAALNESIEKATDVNVGEGRPQTTPGEPASADREKVVG
jgi:hypothetical protein